MIWLGITLLVLCDGVLHSRKNNHYRGEIRFANLASDISKNIIPFFVKIQDV